MLHRGLQTMDELDEVEEREQQEKESMECVSCKAATTTPNELFGPFTLNPRLVLD